MNLTRVEELEKEVRELRQQNIKLRQKLEAYTHRNVHLALENTRLRLKVENGNIQTQERNK